MMRTVNRKWGRGGQQPGRLAATTTKFRTDRQTHDLIKQLKYFQGMLWFSEQQPRACGAPGSVLGQDAGCFCVPEER